MSRATDDVVKRTFDHVARASGFSRRSSTWYRRTPELVQVLNLQRSSWSRLYYVNVGLWLLALGDNDHPKEYQCHVRTRLDGLLADEAHEVGTLLDLENALAEEERAQRLEAVLRVRLIPVLDEVQSLRDLKGPRGRRLRDFVLVDALALLGSG